MQEEWDKSYENYLNDILPLIFDESVGETYEHNIELEKKYRKEEVEDGYNYIDRKGNKLIDEPLKKVYEFENGIARIENKEGKYNLIDEDGNILCDEWYDFIYSFDEDTAIVEKNNKRSFINDKGKRITEEWFDYAYSFSEGFARVQVYDRGRKSFLIDKEGNHILEDECYYNICSGIHGGFAKISIAPPSEVVPGLYISSFDCRYGYIDLNGKIINNDGQGFSIAEDFVNGRAAVYDGSFYIIDSNGKPINNETYNHIERHNNYYVARKKYDSDYYILDLEGNKIYDEPFNSFYYVGSSPTIFYVRKEVEINGSTLSKVYFLDANGKLSKESYIWREPTKHIEHIKNSDYFKIKVGEKYRIVDQNGKLINKEEYDNVFESWCIGGNFFYVEKNKKYYILKSDGTYLSNLEFDEPIIGSGNGYVEVKYKKRYNFISTNTGKLVLEKGFLRHPYSKYISKNFVECFGNIICTDTDMKDYKVEKKLSGYKCTNKDGTFIIKYTPIKVFGSLILCHDKYKLYMYDTKEKTEQELGSFKDVDFDNNFIINQKERTVQLIYNNKLIDITDYYIKNIHGKKSVKIYNGVDIFSKDEFFRGNEEDIRNRFKEAEKEKARILEERKHKEESKQLHEIEKQNEFQKAKNKIALAEAVRQVIEATKTLERLSRESGSTIRMKISGLFIDIDRGEDKYREINPMFIETGLIRYADLSNEDFVNVKLSGLNLSNSNIVFYPTKVYKKDLRGCNFEGVYFPISTSFTGVDVRGARFTNDKSPATFDIKEENFSDAYYDETTLLNGVPITELLKKEEKGSKTA